MTTQRFVKNKTKIFLLLSIGLVSVLLVSAVWVRTNTQYTAESIQQQPIMLDVPPLTQLQATSCGEAVIVMAHNYASDNESALLNETEVIAYAAENGYFTEEAEPFTSPANMLKITRHYTSQYANGLVSSANQGLALLIRNLKNGDPVIIDVLTHLDDPTSSAHFVLVSGIAVDPHDVSLITIYFNNPLTGVNESAPWHGDTGIWHAWQNNPDPGGSGWWLVISPPN